MTDETQRQIVELDRVPWFENVGIRTSSDAIFVDTWEQAVTSCEGEVYDSVRGGARNNLYQELFRRDLKRYRQWYSIEDQIRSAVERITGKALSSVPDEISEEMWFIVQWDVRMICMETEFQMDVPPQFFVPRLLPWYVAGHFPCGWDGPRLSERWVGKLPNARLYIY